MKDGVTGTDVGEKSIAKSLSWMSSLHQTRNVHNIQESRNLAREPDKEEMRQERRNVWQLTQTDRET